jgi:hypothetical protein
MNTENAPMKVRYKYESDNKYGDLVCELTEFMDNYLLGTKRVNNLYRTYLYNDIGVFSEPSALQIAFRTPRSNKR